MNKWIITEGMLDDTMYRFLCKKDDKVNLISGGVRSGKTLFLLHKCKQILSKDSNAGITWIVSNNVYKAFLCTNLNKIGIKGKVVTIFEFLKNNSKSDYIFVDEASFLTENQLKIVIKSAIKGLFISITQGKIQPPFFSLKNQKSIDTESVANNLSVIPQPLYFSYLNNGTKGLISAIYREESDVTISMVDNNPKCQYEEIQPKYTIEEFIRKLIENRSDNNVGILYFTNEDIYNANNKFNELGLKVEARYNYNRKLKNDIDFSSNKPKLLTIHSSVGIIFDSIFIVLNENVINNFSDYQGLLAYALTRGGHYITIISNCTLPDVIKDNAFSVTGNAIMEI